MLVSGRVPGWRTVYDSGVTRCGVTADKAYKISSILPCKVCKFGVAVVSEFDTVLQQHFGAGLRPCKCCSFWFVLKRISRWSLGGGFKNCLNVHSYFGKMIPFRRSCKKSPHRFLDSKKSIEKTPQKIDLKRSFDTSTFWSLRSAAGAALRQDWCLQAAFAARVTFETSLKSGQIHSDLFTAGWLVTLNDGLIRETFVFHGNLGWWNIISWSNEMIGGVGGLETELWIHSLWGPITWDW